MLKSYRLTFFLPLLLLFSSWAQADSSYSNVYVFGDSLSDTGNLASVTGPFPFPFFANRVSNGPVAVETLASRLGLGADASLHLVGPEVGTNYAVAGAQAVGSGPINLNFQVLGFLSNHAFAAPSDALYVLFIGGNDVRSARDEADFSVAKLKVKAAADEVRRAIETLAMAGARSFLLANVPNIGAMPESRILANVFNDPGLVKRARKLSKLYRKEVHHIAEELGDEDEYDDGDNAISVIEFDLFKFFNRLLKKADRQGFTNTTDACFSSVTRTFHPDCNFGANFDQFVFFDEIHPTARVHALAGEALFEAIEEHDD